MATHNWYPGKLFDRVFRKETSERTETIGEWLERMGQLEKSLTGKQRLYLLRDHYYRAVIEAIDFQISSSSRYITQFRDLPTSDMRTFYFHLPSDVMGVHINPEEVEQIIRFWQNPENVALADIAVPKLNEEIRERTGYGARGQLTPEDGYVLTWSNGGERWVVYGQKWMKGEELKPQSYGMDANQIFAAYPHDFLQRIVSSLDPLPLFMGSLESKERGKIGWTEGFDLWSLRQKMRLEEEKEREKHR